LITLAIVATARIETITDNNSPAEISGIESSSSWR
jgi:hypothetical protein